MFGIGVQELLIILVIALLVLGPTKLPAAAKAIAKGVQEMRRASDDLRQAFLFDDADTPSRSRWTPLVEDSPRSPSPPRPAQPHGTTLPDAEEGEELLVRPMPVDDLVSRGQEGGDPHKRAQAPSSTPAPEGAQTTAQDERPAVSTHREAPLVDDDEVSSDLRAEGVAPKEPIS